MLTILTAQPPVFHPTEFSEPGATPPDAQQTILLMGNWQHPPGKNLKWVRRGFSRGNEKTGKMHP
jgi:hypothetical protein